MSKTKYIETICSNCGKKYELLKYIYEVEKEYSIESLDNYCSTACWVKDVEEKNSLNAKG